MTFGRTEQNRDKNGYYADRWVLTDYHLLRVKCVDTHQCDYPCAELITDGINHENWKKS